MSPGLAGRFFTTSTTWEDPGLSQTYCELCECRGTQSNEWFIEQIEQLTVVQEYLAEICIGYLLLRNKFSQT